MCNCYVLVMSSKVITMFTLLEKMDNESFSKMCNW